MERLHIIFGSTSDEEKVLPGIVRATKEIPDLEVVVHYASVDNTPDKVQRIMREYSSPVGKRVYISGAGMSNVLTGVVKTYATLNDLVIGIPISDPQTEGVSSFLSTGEKPPMNPILTVGLNESYAAINIAYRFLQGTSKNLVIFENNVHTIKEPDYLQKVKNFCEEVGLRYEPKSFGEIGVDDVVISFFDDVFISSFPNIRQVDRKLKEGRGIQVSVCYKMDDLLHYSQCLADTSVTGVVSIDSFTNAAIVAAQLTENRAALEAIKAKREDIIRKLQEHRGLVVYQGNVIEK